MGALSRMYSWAAADGGSPGSKSITACENSNPASQPSVRPGNQHRYANTRRGIPRFRDDRKPTPELRDTSYQLALCRPPIRLLFSTIIHHLIKRATLWTFKIFTYDRTRLRAAPVHLVRFGNHSFLLASFSFAGGSSKCSHMPFL